MNRLFLVAFAAFAVLAGCRKANEETQQAATTQMIAKTSAPDIQVINGRLVFANIDACEKFALTYANVPDSALDSLEMSMGYLSYRRNKGIDFYDDTKTLVESSILGTVLNPDAVYQVGDSAFYVYKTGEELKVNMLSGVTEEGIGKLKSGGTDKNIYEVTDLDLYGDMAKATNQNCGLCRTTQEKLHVKKADFTYNWQGQTRYCKGKTKMEQIGALKTIFARINHYRGAEILTPLPGNCRFFISGCAKYQYKIGNTCYTKNTEMAQPPQGASGYGVTSHQITYAIVSKCYRNFYTESLYSFQYETSTSSTQTHNYPTNYRWEKGFNTCY